MTKLDKKWEEIFSDYSILNDLSKQPYYDISSNMINEYYQSRLMCKVDFKEKIPKPLKDNNLSILAIKNGIYRIASTSPFLDIKDTLFKSEPDSYFKLPNNLETLNADNISSESKALDAAHLSGMLEQLITNSLYLTIRGREVSESFSFYLRNQTNENINYDISGVQIEIDGGYEGDEVILLIEAKMDFQNNMNIRQLLYPQLNYEVKYNKKIISYVMFYEIGGKFHFVPFIYDGKQCEFNFDGYKLYQLEQSCFKDELNFEEIVRLKIDDTRIDQSQNFPQADSFDKVYSTFLKIPANDFIEKDVLFNDYDISLRQYNYYLDVLLWMKLAYTQTKSKSYISLTDKGVHLINMNEKERFLEMARIIFSNSIFNMILNDQEEKISNEMISRNKMKPDSTTYPRRKSTVKAWIKYFKNKFEELNN